LNETLRIVLMAGFLAFGIRAPATEAPGNLRARDLGVPFQGDPGPLNAITDVAGVEVGQVTLVSGDGTLVVGSGPVRTGVTAVLPRGKDAPFDPVFAAWFAENGNGEMTGTTWVEESGLLWGPVMITNTHSVGTVRDAVIDWARRRYHLGGEEDRLSAPVVAETWDGWLNDIYGFHVRAEHAFRALDSATAGPVTEGNVGGGTGNISFGFKGGMGTASRRVHDQSGDYLLGVLVQTNFGIREQLSVAGVPIGREIPEEVARVGRADVRGGADAGSIIVVLATDAPLLPHQLKRIARRVSLGIARTGGTANHTSGDIFIAFSTANRGAGAPDGAPAARLLPNEHMSPLFQATVDATEEAIINALVAAQTLTGVDGHTAMALPHDRLVAALRKYNRLTENKDSGRRGKRPRPY
jgi:L-aminopeptidase/D-esterase-like protein